MAVESGAGGCWQARPHAGVCTHTLSAGLTPRRLVPPHLQAPPDPTPLGPTIMAQLLASNTADGGAGGAPALPAVPGGVALPPGGLPMPGAGIPGAAAAFAPPMPGGAPPMPGAPPLPQ